MATAVAAAATAGDGSSASPVLLAGNAPQLFVDDRLIAAAGSANLTRSTHSPDCSRVVVTADAEWEENMTVGVLGASVIRDGGRLRLWYPLRNSTLGCRPAGVPVSVDDRPNCRPVQPPPSPPLGLCSAPF